MWWKGVLLNSKFKACINRRAVLGRHPPFGTMPNQQCGLPYTVVTYERSSLFLAVGQKMVQLQFTLQSSSNITLYHTTSGVSFVLIYHSELKMASRLFFILAPKWGINTTKFLLSVWASKTLAFNHFRYKLCPVMEINNKRPI